MRTPLDVAHDSVLVVPNRDRATLVVTGADRVSWLNGLVTSDLAKKGVGEASYGLFVGRNGRILADVFVVLDETRALASVPVAVVAGLQKHLDHYLVMEDAEVAANVDGFETWTVHGPQSEGVLAAARRQGGVGGLVDRTGLGGAIVLAPVERAAAVRSAIESSSAERGGAVGDDGAWEALRLECAVARFGLDFDDKAYPQEAALEKVAVSFSKGCYLGQEVVCMLELRGHVNRKLAALIIDAGHAPPPGTTVADAAGGAIGVITSSGMSLSRGKPIAFAMLKRAHTEPGARVFVGAAGARVVERPAPGT